MVLNIQLSFHFISFHSDAVLILKIIYFESLTFNTVCLLVCFSLVDIKRKIKKLECVIDVI